MEMSVTLPISNVAPELKHSLTYQQLVEAKKMLNNIHPNIYDK